MVLDVIGRSLMNDKFKAGDKVLYSADNRVGEITGKYREQSDKWQVLFNGVDLLYVPGEKLTPVNGKEDVYDLFQEGRFQGISDYRRSLYRYRMSGRLTNIMYSMDNAVASFHAHQFIPVIKFLESYTDRLLIADEVGLGKTIEAMYIWEELRARKNAKRLLVVVPAVLRDKWRGDIKKFFGIEADIVSAQGRQDASTVLSKIRDARKDAARTSFALIVSLEGLRIANEVRKELDECKDIELLFDLVIIDEAHYLRNSETEGFKTGEALRDVAKHMLLLSATPIQTSSDNFFNLLSLLAPEDFADRSTFDAQLMENRPLVRLSNALERNDKAEVVKAALDEALATDVFANDDDLKRLRENFDAIVSDTHQRVRMIHRIKGKYFYSGLVTRSRKRDVFPNRTQRNVVSVNFKLNDYERMFYEYVSGYLRNADDGRNVFSSFRLIARQRQMASCIPAALRSWRGLGVDDDFDEEVAAEGGRDFARMANMPQFEGYDLEQLELNDSKFARVVDELNRILKENPKEKVIIFSFFRNTVRYLFERLRNAGFSVDYIMGGLSLEDKTNRISAFRDTGTNILVSSEVGSEGIDLQFARYELNYDLPWNPMRLEQRIGRIDRIGQESDQIFICNAYCENTIEDRVLARLYQRIEVFRNVIGDIEEVMGEQIKNFEVNVFRSGEMTEEQINERTEQVLNAMYQSQELRKSLELEVGNMASAYQNFVLGNIRSSYEANRLLTATELMFFCKDVLEEKFEGSSVLPVEGTSVAHVKLSDVARRGITNYIANNPGSVVTQLGSTPAGIRCNFGKKQIGEQPIREGYEIIDINHPLTKWLLGVVEKDAIYTSGCEIVSLRKSELPKDVDVSSGFYAYAVQDWRARGVKNVDELRYYFAKGLYDDSGNVQIVTGEKAEKLLVTVMMHGGRYDVNLLDPADYNACGMALSAMTRQMDAEFDAFEEDQKKLNHDLVIEQSEYVSRTAAMKAGKINAMIDKMRFEGKKESVIKMNIARRDKVLESRDQRIARIRERLDCGPEYADVAVGILNIKED